MIEIMHFLHKIFVLKDFDVNGRMKLRNKGIENFKEIEFSVGLEEFFINHKIPQQLYKLKIYPKVGTIRYTLRNP